MFSRIVRSMVTLRFTAATSPRARVLWVSSPGTLTALSLVLRVVEPCFLCGQLSCQLLKIEVRVDHFLNHFFVL